MTPILKEPFVHFLLIGAAVFTIKGFWNSPTTEIEKPADTNIVIDDNVMKSLESRLPENVRNEDSNAAEYQRLLKDAVEQYTRDEMFFREAKRRHLDENDFTVRQHLINKLKMLATAQASAEPFPDTQIAAYYAKNRNFFSIESHADIDQIFFDRAKRGDTATSDCNLLWQRILNESDLPEATLETFGDRRHGYRRHMTVLNRERLNSLFGKAISDKILAVEHPGWLPPLESPDGCQLIKVTGITRSGYEPLDNVRSQIVYQLELARNEQAVTNLYEKLKKKYLVVKK